MLSTMLFAFRFMAHYLAWALFVGKKIKDSYIKVCKSFKIILGFAHSDGYEYAGVLHYTQTSFQVNGMCGFACYKVWG